MAEERVVRLRLERVGFDDAAKDSGTLEQRLDRLATAEQRLNREAKPAAASISKLAQEEGKAGSAAGSATPKVDKLGDEIQQTGKQAATAGGQIDKAGDQMRGLGGFAGQMATKVIAAAGAFLSFQAVKGILSDAVAAIKEDEAATALLEARIRSTGGAAERSLEQLDALAGGLSRGTGIDDEAIKNAEIELQSFDHIYGDVFDRAIRLAADLGAVSGDVAGEITLLGKALQDPEEGIAGLEKNIGRLTDAQSDLIKETAKLGEHEKAQGMLLDIVERRVGGTAAAYRDTLGGALRAASTEWENQLELLRTGLSPAIRQIAEDFVNWSQSAKGQEQIVATGRQLGDIIAKLGASLRDLDAEQLAKVLDLALGIVGPLVDVVDLLNTIGNWTPAHLIFEGLVEGASRLKKELQSAWETFQKLPQRLDPRAMTGAAAGVMGPQPGMTDAERKMWAEEEAAANRSHQREQERQADFARTAALEAKKLQSARDAATKMVEGIKQEAAERQASLAILKQEGVSREDLVKQVRELEIQQKAAAKVEEVRLAYLKAGMVLTDRNADAIRAWVIQAEGAADAAKKWASIEPPKTLKPIVIPVTAQIIDQGQIKTIVAEWGEASRAEMEAVAAHLGSLEEIRQSNQASLDEHSQAIYDDLTEQALALKDSLTTPKEELAEFNRYLDELGKVTDSTGQAILAATEIEKLRVDALAQYNINRINDQISAWGGLFSYIGDAFGGVAARISQALSNIQAGMQTGSQIGSSIGGMTSAGSAAGGAAGAAGGAIFAVWYEAVQWMKSELEKAKAESYGYAASVSRGPGPGKDWKVDLEGQARKASNSIKAVIEALADVLGGTVESFAALEIQVRRDGKYFHAFVSGQFIGWFTDMQSAVDAAILAALKDPATMFAGVGDLMRQGLEYALSEGTVKVGSLDELQEFLAKLREISDLDLSSGAIETKQAINHLNDLWEALARLDSATPAVIEGFEDLGASIVQSWQSWADSISGRQKSAKELLAAKEKDAKLFEKQKALFIAEQKYRVLELKEKLENLKGKAGIIKHEGEIDAGSLDLRIKFLSAEAELVGAEADLGAQRIALIEEQIKAIEGIIAEIEKIETPTPGLGGRGGGSGVDTKDLRQQLRDEIAAIQAELRGPIHAAFYDFQQSILDFRERAKEAKLPADELAAGIAALTEQFKRSLLEQARAYAGQGTDFTARLTEVRNFFAGLRELGRKKTGIADWRVDALEGQALAKLGGEIQQTIAEFGGLANPMLAIQMQAADLRANLTAFAEAAGWSAEQIAAAQAAIDAGVEYQRQQGINGVLDRVFSVLEQAGLFEEDRQEFERQKIDLEYALLEAQLRFYDAWTEQTAAWVNAAHDFERAGASVRRNIEHAADRWDDTLFQNATRAFQTAVQDWRSGIKEYSDTTRSLLTNEELSGLTQEQQLATARQQFLDLAARARGGDVEALRQLSQAREEFLAESRQSNQGGSGYDADWQLAMVETADLLSHAQETEEAVRARAIQEVINNASTNADQVTTAVYDGAAQVVAAIYRLMQGLPAYGDGGYVDRPHLAIVGDRPEYILPAVPGLRGPGTVTVAHGVPSTDRSDALLDKMLREQRRHTPALRSTAYSAGSTARSSRDLLDAETRARVVNGRKR